DGKSGAAPRRTMSTRSGASRTSSTLAASRGTVGSNVGDLLPSTLAHAPPRPVSTASRVDVAQAARRAQTRWMTTTRSAALEAAAEEFGDPRGYLAVASIGIPPRSAV